MTWPEPPSYYDPKPQAYKVVLQTPDYPVVFPDPTFAQTLTNMRPSSWALVAGMAAFGAAAGYYKGSTQHWQKPAMYFGSVFFGKSAFLWGLGDSAYRLMGYKENGREVATNIPGVLTPEAY